MKFPFFGWIWNRRSPRATAGRAFAAILTLLFPISARAEEALASLLWVIPAAIAQEFYFRLVEIYPWLFGAMALTFLWHAFTGRDMIPFLFDTDSRDGLLGGRMLGFNLHRALAWATGFATMYIVFGTMLMNPKNLRIPERPSQSGAASHAQLPPSPPPPPAPPTPPLHPISGGAWPITAGYLVPNRDPEKGLGRVIVFNEERSGPVFVKLCRDVPDACVLQRQFYLPPRTSLLVDNLSDGNYRLFFIENLAPAFGTGSSTVVRMSAGRAHELKWTIPATTLASAERAQDRFVTVTREAFDAVR